MLVRLAYLGVTNGLAMLRLLPMPDWAKDVEILALRHQLTVLERQLGGAKVRFAPADRAFLAALLHRLPRVVLHQIRLMVRPETALRWHRDLVAARHARLSRPRRVGRPRTVRSIRLLVLRLAREADDLRLFDATPVPCGTSRETVRRSALAGLAGYGYCASHSRWYWGLKLYLLTTAEGMPVAWCLANPKIGEREVAQELLAHARDRAALRDG